MTTYTNPWHRPGSDTYGPATFETDVSPTTYRGYLIYERIKGHCWDVVKDGTAVTQMAGINGAHHAIDRIHLAAEIVGKTAQVRHDTRPSYYRGRAGIVQSVLASYDSRKARPYLSVIIEIDGLNTAFDVAEVVIVDDCAGLATAEDTAERHRERMDARGRV